MSTEGSTVRLRSIYVSPEPDTEAQNGDIGPSSEKGGDDWGWINGDGAPPSSPSSPTNGEAPEQYNNAADDEKEDTKIKNPLELPQSTHSLLFTERACSLPHFFAVAIILISFGCLTLALTNNLSGGTRDNKFNIPVNVSASVRAAQYLSIFIALLMEEEIPMGLYLLRQIRKQDLNKKLQHVNYKKYVFAAILRIFSGYFFLINVFVVLVQATGVIEIFYDVLALQFVQQLDDIGFGLAKMEVLGKRMRRACTCQAFDVEFEKEKHHCKKQEAILKSLYFINFGLFLTGMIIVSSSQSKGYYQCNSITAELGDEVWDAARALNIEMGLYEEFTLVFSYFSGAYVLDGYRAGRPVYKELRKFDRQPYDSSRVVPAEISYCQEIRSWVLRHDYIRKGNDESGCNWLLRSQETDEFDLLNVGSDWRIWVGVIGSTTVHVTCNECSDNTDCNLNGQCVDGKCQCYTDNGARYLGMHCETRLSDECNTIIGETQNQTFSIDYYSSKPDGPVDTLFQEYSRPVYTYVSGIEGIAEDDIMWLMYTGNRWFGMRFNLKERNATAEDLVVRTKNFHAFWYRAYNTVTQYVSDPTKGSTPVGTDWYFIGERGSQYGPFGALYPIQMYNQTGRGFFRCAGEYIPPVSDGRRLLDMKRI